MKRKDSAAACYFREIVAGPQVSREFRGSQIRQNSEVPQGTFCKLVTPALGS